MGCQYAVLGDRDYWEKERPSTTVSALVDSGAADGIDACQPARIFPVSSTVVPLITRSAREQH